MLRDKIKKLCAEQGKTVSQLEEELHLSGNTITRWNGVAGPSTENLVKVANALNVSVDELLREEE